MISFSNPFTAKGISQALDGLFEKQEKIYFAIAALATGLGYFMLALFPLIAFIGIFKILGGMASASTFFGWLGVLIWMGITAAAAAITYSMATVKIQMPSGLGLKEDKAPRLHELINEINQTYSVPKIDRIIVHDHCELDMISVPRFGLPLLNTNVLYIGLPVLQCLSPAHFKGALARKLGQFSAQHNRLTHWIYRWRQYCFQYQRSYNRTKSPLFLPLKLFFKYYIPMLEALTVHAARRDEIEADMYALQILNDEELADVILQIEVSKQFLKTKYWPKLFAMLRKNPQNPERLPHISMPGVLRKALTENEFAQTMKELLNNEPTWRDGVPSLIARLEHIGQTKLNMPPPVMETAAQRYLGDAFSAVVKLLDKQWLAKNGKVKKSKAHDEHAISFDDEPAPAPAVNSKSKKSAKVKQPTQKQKTPATPPTVKNDESMLETTEVAEDLPIDEKNFRSLRSKATKSMLSKSEAFEYATLTEKFEGKAAAILMYQKILKQDSSHAKTIFAVGRILLSQNDQSGVKILEKAMQLDKGCIAQACWMLAKYFKSTGNDDLSKSYLERAANVSAAA